MIGEEKDVKVPSRDTVFVKVYYQLGVVIQLAKQVQMLRLMNQEQFAEFEAVPEVERKTVNKYTHSPKAGERVFMFFSTNLKTKDLTQSLSTPF